MASISHNITAQVRTFCAAISSVCGHGIKVVCDGQACTDGKTIHLPYPHQIQAPNGTQVVLGIGCHETAHVYYDTSPRYAEFASMFDGEAKTLAADCYNAVADVAEVTDGAVGGATPSHVDELPYVQHARDVKLDFVFRRYAKLLLAGPERKSVMPSRSGRVLGDLSRWKTDGKAMKRSVTHKGIGTAVAVCLDCSYSMRLALPRVAAAACSMSKALRDASGNIRCWHFGSDVQPVSVKKMSRVRLMGETSTDMVVAEAMSWLRNQLQERRVICVFTDGQANSPERCAEQVRLATRLRMKLLVGAVNYSVDALSASMPGAHLFEIDDLARGFHRAISQIAR